MKRRDFLTKTGAFLVYSGSLLEILASETKPKLKNYLVLDIDGNPRNYEKEGAPICDVPLGEETYKYCSGINEYLNVSGKPALIAFMSYDCTPCKVNLPIINKIYDKYKNKLQVIGVNFINKREPKEEIIKKTKKLLKNNKVKFPNLTMLQKYVWATIGDVVREPSDQERVALPQYFLVDENKFVTYRTRKLWEKEEEKSLIKEIEKILEKK